MTYNQEKTISRTLNSILSQEIDFPMEIIIGDDASIDNTESVCKEYAAKYPEIIRYVRNSENKGLRDNYYDCLLMAKGEYIADVAGDDFWIDTLKLKKQVEILDNEPNVSLVCTDWENYDEISKRLYSPWKESEYPYKNIFKDNDLKIKLLSHLNPFPIHLCTSLYRKSSFFKLYNQDSTPFRNKEFIPEDLQLVVLLSTVGEIRYLDIKSLAYSKNTVSITGDTDFKKVFDFHFSALKLTKLLADKTGVNHNSLSSVYQNIIQFVTMQAFYAYDQKRIDLIKQFVKDWKLKTGIKTKIIFSMSNLRWIWKITRLLKTSV